MPWIKGILLFTMAVTILSSSLRSDLEASFDTGYPHGVISENPIRFGRLLIGAQGAVSDKEMKISGLRTTEQSDEYRSNQEERFHLAKAKLRRLSPFVHCGNDSMTLRVPGSRTPHFLVDRGEHSPVPLSEIPASCGFSLKRTRRDVSLIAPYKACYVRLQDGSYNLPLLIKGAPMQMSCPVSLPRVSCFPYGMIISLGTRASDVKLQVDGSWQPLLQTYFKCSFTLDTVDGSLVMTAPFRGRCWKMKDTDMQLPLMYCGREVMLSCPMTRPTLAPTTTTTAPFLFGEPWRYPLYFPGVQPVAPTVPPTTTTPTIQDPSHQMFPQMYPMPMFYPFYFDSRGYPVAPQFQQSMYPIYPPYVYPFKSPVETTTPFIPTAVEFEQFAGYPPVYPKFYGPQSFVPPGVKIPFMPQDSVFIPQSPKLASSPAKSSTSYSSRRHYF